MSTSRRRDLILLKPWLAMKPGSLYNATPAEAELLIGRGIAEEATGVPDAGVAPEEESQLGEIPETAGGPAAPPMDRSGPAAPKSRRDVAGPPRRRR